MELTESEKKGLRRFSLLLESLSDKPWQLSLWFDDGTLYDSIHHNKYFFSRGANGQIEIDLFMEALIDNFLREIEKEDLLNHYCYDDYCKGSVVFEINPKDKTFNIILDYEIETSENHSTTYGFEEFIDLNDEELEIIEPFIKRGISHTVDFNGGGDSGYIEDEDNSTGTKIPQFIIDMMYEILNTDYRGWEIDSGSVGDFEIDYTNQRIYCRLTEFDTARNEEVIKVLDFKDERN